MTYELPLTSAFGAFFTDRWSFILKSSYTNSAPIYSQIIIDITQSGQATTATCELLTQGQSGNSVNPRYIFCVSDLAHQTDGDTIVINK